MIAAVRGEAVEKLLAGGNTAVRFMVGGRCPVGMPEGDYGMGQRISQHDKGLAAAGDLDRYVALRMAARVNGADTGSDVLTRLERPYLLLDA
jgi:hypothetical protein